MGWWEYAPLLLMATQAPDKGIRGLAVKLLEMMVRDSNVVVARPGETELNEVETALKKYSAGSPEGIRERLTSILVYCRAWGK